MSPLLTTQNPTEMDSDIISKCDCLLIPGLHGFQLTIPIDWPSVGQILCHPNAKLKFTLPKDYLKSGIKSHQLRKNLKIIMLSERIQTKMSTHCLVPYI